MEGHLSSGFGSQNTCLEIYGNPEDVDCSSVFRCGANFVRRWPSCIKIGHAWFSLSTELIGVVKGGDQLHDSLLMMLT